MRPILVDSSVLIDYLRGRGGPAVEFLDRTINERQIALGDLILMEVLQGIRNPRELREAEAALESFPCFELAGVDRARSAAASYRALRSAGITPRSPVDVLIATFCIEEEFAILANDRDFRLMAPVLGLQLAGPALQ